VLLRLDDNPVVALNHAVAVSMITGPRAGLELIQHLGADPRINADRRFHAVRAHLLEMAGERAAALEAYRAAARAATNLQQQRYLNQQIGRLAQGPAGAGQWRSKRTGRAALQSACNAGMRRSEASCLEETLLW
jgi:predicted RNA polymerase sigma factor